MNVHLPVIARPQAVAQLVMLDRQLVMPDFQLVMPDFQLVMPDLQLVMPGSTRHPVSAGTGLRIKSAMTKRRCAMAKRRSVVTKGRRSMTKGRRAMTTGCHDDGVASMTNLRKCT
ncbi:MAG: hypothetical protein D4R79_19300 [Comamonadaceae bacterium]|nr:MAG: hypothetical protein D4R79_19300 [Comamonadaceae bacterium]